MYIASREVYCCQGVCFASPSLYAKRKRVVGAAADEDMFAPTRVITTVQDDARRTQNDPRRKGGRRGSTAAPAPGTTKMSEMTVSARFVKLQVVLGSVCLLVLAYSSVRINKPVVIRGVFVRRDSGWSSSRYRAINIHEH